MAGVGTHTYSNFMNPNLVITGVTLGANTYPIEANIRIVSFTGNSITLANDAFATPPGTYGARFDISFREIPAPAPGALALLGAGLTGLLVVRSRHRVAA
jgi:hypothetical protein